MPNLFARLRKSPPEAAKSPHLPQNGLGEFVSIDTIHYPHPLEER
jgi:hypothetical protein